MKPKQNMDRKLKGPRNRAKDPITDALVTACRKALDITAQELITEEEMNALRKELQDAIDAAEKRAA